MIKKDAFIILRVTTELKSKLDKKASKASQTLSKYIREILEKI